MKVRKILVLQEDGSPHTLYERKARKKRKKGTAGLRELEKVLRRSNKANMAVMNNYMKRHNRSNRKRRDGWLRDIVINSYRANVKGMKELSKIF